MTVEQATSNATEKVEEDEGNSIMESLVDASAGAVTVPPGNFSAFKTAFESVIPSALSHSTGWLWRGSTFPTWTMAFEVTLGVMRDVLVYQRDKQREWYLTHNFSTPEERRAALLSRTAAAREKIEAGLMRTKFDDEGIELEDLEIKRKDYRSFWWTGDRELDSKIDERGLLSAEMVSHKNSKEDRLCIYLHGGAYTAMSPRTHRSLTSVIARHAKCGVLVVDYRLAPDYPFPSAVYDAVVAYAYVVHTMKLDPQRIIIAGDSAGGGLTAALLHYIRDYGNKVGLASPGGAVMFSPWLDLSGTSGPSWTDKNLPDYLPPLESTPPTDYWDPSVAYVGDFPLKHPLASPLWGKWDNLPPFLVQIGGVERLRSDAVKLAEIMKKNGEDKWAIETYPGGCHVFQGFSKLCQEGRTGLERATSFMEEIWDSRKAKEIFGSGEKEIRVLDSIYERRRRSLW